MYPNLRFHHVDDEYIRSCFRDAYADFDLLHDHPLTLECLPLQHHTMRAQPIINWAFLHRATRHYRIQMSNHLAIAQYVRLAELPREVLVGWFAHELGHVVDYHRRTAAGLLQFVIGYVLFPGFRAGAERRADIYAIEQGFGEALMATKLYILEKSDLPNMYKDRIRRYYLSPTELEDMLYGESPKRVHF
ncbi:MAG: hypothetical protein KDC54_15340 [Lewinella sp.]|nr:hypothetical protein [Lewinella sp.]